MESSAAIVVKNDQQWAGNPRLGAITVDIDGSRNGLVLPRGEARITVDVGSHSLRVGQWWFRSQLVTVTVAAGEVVTLCARRPTGVRGFVRLAIRPFSSLTVERQ